MSQELETFEVTVASRPKNGYLHKKWWRLFAGPTKLLIYAYNIRRVGNSKIVILGKNIRSKQAVEVELDLYHCFGKLTYPDILPEELKEYVLRANPEAELVESR